TRRWFGPVGWPLTLCEMDFRVGGKWRFAMTGDSGVQSTPFGGTYLEIVPNRRIKFDNSFEEEGSKTMIMTWDYEDLGARSRLTMTTLFESVAMKNEYLAYGMEEGVASSFDQLAEVAAEIAHH
ncbi:MAG TPA: SRPBCC domain-containing protein, partial [Thermomicrobiales bacterium]|nr:SRPBCC domain-containing protein [Thermomicrobiales bacterium]